MIYAYAVDPEAIDDFKTLTSVVDLMDYPTSRRLYLYPKNSWTSQIVNNLSNGTNETKIITYLSSFTYFSINSTIIYDANQTWIRNAVKIEKEHSLKGILNKNKTKKCYIKLNEINSRHPTINVNHSFCFDREASKIVDNFEAILMYAKRIVFVDRYIHIKKPYCLNVLEEIKNRIISLNRIGQVNLAFCISKEIYEEIGKKEVFDFFTNYRNCLCNDIDLYIIESNKFHNRFLLSEISSFQGGIGFSDNSNNGGVCDDDITPLDFKHYEKRLSDYTQTLIDEHIPFSKP